MEVLGPGHFGPVISALERLSVDRDYQLEVILLPPFSFSLAPLWALSTCLLCSSPKLYAW